MDFLTYYVNFRNKEMMIKFEQEAEKLTGRTEPMGVREILLDRAKREGREEERLKALAEKKQMARDLKTNGVDLDIISKVTGLSIEEINKL